MRKHREIFLHSIRMSVQRIRTSVGETGASSASGHVRHMAIFSV